MNLFVIAGIIGPQEIIIILVIVLLLFGGKKIPELMRGLGKGKGRKQRYFEGVVRRIFRLLRYRTLVQMSRGLFVEDL